MKFHPMAHGVALAALFLVGGCGADPTGDRAGPSSGPELAKAEIARPPAVSEEANAAEAEPLNDAGEIASEIESNTLIGRVPVDGGLAWLQDGQVVRTASQDGRRIAYFHPGENRPFLVQRGERAFAYRDGRPQLAYDDDGRPARISPAASAEAERLAAESLRERAAAEQDLPGEGDD
ncbi:MAG TPA: hypothetical protein VEC11_05660 [Allosphingosinicella sp.]|nr:hypothetical protein [Allosphingosinicella sp.]